MKFGTMIYPNDWDDVKTPSHGCLVRWSIFCQIIDVFVWLSICSFIMHIKCSLMKDTYMGVSENSVPLNPMVLLIIIPIKWLFHWEYTLFSDILPYIARLLWIQRHCCFLSPNRGDFHRGVVPAVEPPKAGSRCPAFLSDFWETS